MKKVSILLVVLMVNLTFLSCTEENLAEVTNPEKTVFASNGEEEKPTPEEEPPVGED